MKKNQIIIFFFPIVIVLFLVVGIIIFPQESIKSAKEGLNIWVNVLIPSLLPFIIGANLIVELKIVDLIGVIINPITKFVFNVSGKSALVFVISTVSGYPVGAKLAYDLRDKGQISSSEAQRLVSFCSTSGPLFIIGAVAVGMFNNPSLGYLMILCHYLGSISVGILFRNYGKEKLSKSNINIRTNFKNIISTRYSSNIGFFVMFGNAVVNGVNTLLAVGGFVIVFSVVFKVLSLFNIISLLATILSIPLSLFGVTKELCYAFIGGLFEITIGCSNISQVASASLSIKASLSSFLIGFSGLSILAQCCNFLAKTDIKTNLYILSKLLHGLFAAIFTFLLYPICETTALVSSFGPTYNTLYNNKLLEFYLNNTSLIIPLLFLVYLIFKFVIPNTKISKNAF
ncbi:sporulation integral membrane protein YlbJ [Romboutsia sp. CE17]|uniref:sporulation integral membrane protein YlbJ n=1 Tax=Romboutsia sp. CE17 TaxID=2724150 RepID=UPI001442A4C1|nr:sporulation integral membrane protein YlbJ [Romboutsia sp. CE17]QJA09208.1 sporulation integral membrane protein YlbJ [Romboutsia sp. CE17]